MELPEGTRVLASAGAIATWECETGRGWGVRPPQFALGLLAVGSRCEVKTVLIPQSDRRGSDDRRSPHTFSHPRFWIVFNIYVRPCRKR